MLFSKRNTTLLFIFLLIILLYHIGLLNPLKSLLSIVLSPFQSQAIRFAEPINNQISTLTKSKSELLVVIDALKQEINDLNLRLAKAYELKRENQMLKNILEFKEENSYTIEMANIIYKTNTALEKKLVINKGTNANIKIGNAVIIGKGTLVGIIDNIDVNTARVKLTIDNESDILATIASTDHTISGVVQGIPGGGLNLNLIPKDIPLFPSQQVITNGLQKNIPRELYIGEITNIKQSENEIFNSALIESPYLIEDLTVVGVIVK